MRAVITQIGNSQGIRIPKPVLDQLNFRQDQELELKIVEHKLVIAASHPRKDWEACFAQLSEADLAGGSGASAGTSSGASLGASAIKDDFQAIDLEIDENEWTW